MMKTNVKTIEEVEMALTQLIGQLHNMHVTYHEKMYEEKADEYYSLLQIVIDKHVRVKKLKQRASIL